MTDTIERPSNDYDVDAWQAFYAANPTLVRSVGAAGDEGMDEGGDDAGSDGDAGGDDGGKDGGDAAGKDGGKDQADDSGAEKPWYDGVSDELKKTAERFSSKDDALRAILSMRKRESQVRVPGKDATEEETASYRKAIGVPETAEKYEFPEIPEAFQSEEADAERKEWAKFLHENAVPGDLAKTLIARFYEGEAAKMEAMQKADAKYAEDQNAELEKEWGNEADKNKTLAKRGFDAMAERAGVSAEALNQIETKAGTFLMDDARLLRIFATIGREMGEAGLGGVTSDSERDALSAKIEQVEKNIQKAQSEGKDREANNFYQEKLSLIEKRDGTRAAS